jgi:hypothetical protein
LPQPPFRATLAAMTTPDHLRAWRHSSYHRDEIRASERVGCLHYCEVFTPFEIRRWTDKSEAEPEGDTAVCPRCGIDAVIGSESGYPVTRPFLRLMQAQWFGEP